MAFSTGTKTGAKLRRTLSGTFVAINFWDVLCLPIITEIFNFEVVAVSVFFAFCFCFAKAPLPLRTRVAVIDRTTRRWVLK